MLQKIVDWMKARPILTAVVILILVIVYLRRRPDINVFFVDKNVENFSTCYQRKQIYLNSCDADEPTGIADANIEKRFGKLYITVMANLPYARGGVFHSMWGAYHVFLVDPNGESINLGSMVRGGDRWYRLSTELNGDYSKFTELQIWRQTEDYKPKMILRGSITEQQRSSL